MKKKDKGEVVEETVKVKKERFVKLKKFFGFFWKHKVLTVIIILAIVGGSGFIVQKNKNANIDLGPVVETEVLAKQDITTTISASGKIVCNESKDVVGQLSNQKILTMNYKVGDTINAGDVICTLDTESIELDLADAETSLAATEVNQSNSIDNANMTLTDTQIDGVTDTYRNIDSVDEAQRILDTKKGELAEAQRIYDIEYGIYSDIYSEDTYYDLLEKQAKGSINENDSEKLTRLKAAKSSLETAKANVDAAHKAVDSAQDALTAAQQKYTDNVRHNITSINKSVNSLEDVYANDTTARLSTQKTIRQYNEQLENATVYAPISGVVTSVKYSAGDKYNGDVLLTIEDASKYKIEANIDEYDISDVAIGQRVTFKTNATGSEELEGVVSAIAPRATTTTSTSTSASNSTANYKVTIDILSKNDRIRLDMAAKINIITNEENNVFAVATSAIHTDEETGEEYIIVQEGNALDMGAADVLDADAATIALDKDMASKKKSPFDKEEPAPEIPTRNISVKTGLSNGYYTVVESSELKEGLVVVTSNEDTAMDLDTMMGMMGPMGGL